MYDTYDTIIYGKNNGVVTITLNRPEKFNCMNDSLIAECRDAIGNAETDPEIGAIVITGAGKAFCAGGDITEMMEKQNDAVMGYEHMKSYHGLTNEITLASKPVIGAINGVAAGGGFSLAIMCDIVYASSKSKFRSAFQGIGLVPDCGFIYRMTKLIGAQKTFDIVYTDRMIMPEEAYGMGFVTKVTEPEELLVEALTLAKKLANGPKVMLGYTKKMINMANENTMLTMLEVEARAQAQCFATEDHKIAANAFINKEQPTFIGK